MLYLFGQLAIDDAYIFVDGICICRLMVVIVLMILIYMHVILLMVVQVAGKVLRRTYP